MKTIAIFHPSNELYGADRILVNAINAFPKEDKKVVYLPKDGVLTNYLLERTTNTKVIIHESLPIIYRSLYTPKGMIGFLRSYFKFERFLKSEHEKNKFNLGYVNTLACSFLLPMLSKMKVKNFIHVHEIIESPKVIRKVTAMLMHKYADSVVCVSDAVRDNLLNCKVELTEKAFRLHNGISPIEVGEKVTGGALNFYLFGRIMPKKGQWFLLEALQLIPEMKLRKCMFHLMGGVLKGSEHLMTELKEIIHSQDLEDYVKIKGFSPQIGMAMKDADVCLVPSQMKDPFPTTVLEAMSAGKPVIATNHGGASEAILHGENGLLVNPRNAHQLAMAIEHFIDNRVEVTKYGDAAKKHFETHFTLDTFNEKWMSFYNRIFLA